MLSPTLFLISAFPREIQEIEVFDWTWRQPFMLAGRDTHRWVIVLIQISRFADLCQLIPGSARKHLNVGIE